MAKVGRHIHRLFLRLLNFTQELLAKTQEEKHLKDLKVAREEEKEAETREYARLVLRAHFAEDRNEFLTESAIRWIGKHQR